jgi:serpin B
MQIRYWVPALALTCISLAACGESPGTTEPPFLTQLPRDLTAAEQTIQAGSNSFSFQLLAQLSAADPGKNVFVSPLSVSYALGMALNGAVDQTYQEMATVLGFSDLAEAEINAAYKSLIELLKSLDPAVDMEIANSLWHDQAVTVQPAFNTALTSWFSASTNSRDFRDPSTVTDINNWVSVNTHGRIPTIIDAIQDQEIMFLINAIYFHGKWRRPFDPRDTRQFTFHTGDGRQLDVPMMLMENDTMSFIHDQDIVAVNLTYGNGAFAMAVMRPAGGDIDAFVHTLTGQAWAGIRGRFRSGKAQLYLPKFQLEYERNLSQDLQTLGMPRAFDEVNAQFPRMITQPAQLFISRVQHRAAVTVDEAGTTAAAATAVGVGFTSAPPQLNFDRPFVFVIYERIGGTILFMGKVLELPPS